MSEPRYVNRLWWEYSDIVEMHNALPQCPMESPEQCAVSHDVALKTLLDADADTDQLNAFLDEFTRQHGVENEWEL